MAATNLRIFPGESFLMKLATNFGLKQLRWSLRRLHCPVAKDALVLEVGAGGNPYPRANVLLDAMESTIERNEQELITDRPLVLGLCEELPFKDKSFDFIIASHVLEHTDNPEKFLSELMRVGKAGYIETPDGWFEKICAFTYHRLEVSNVDGRLLIRKKVSWKPEEIAKFWDVKLAKSEALLNFLRLHPDLHHMRFYWENNINYEIVNSEADAAWPYPAEVKKKSPIKIKPWKAVLRKFYLSLRRWLYSQNRRNKKINVFKLLRCPSCHSEQLDIDNSITCRACKTVYEVNDNVPKLFPIEVSGFNQSRLQH